MANIGRQCLFVVRIILAGGRLMNDYLSKAVLLGILTVASGCAAPLVAVSTSGEVPTPLAGPFAIAPGSDPFVVTELGNHGLLAETAPVLIIASLSKQTAKLGICGTVDAAAAGGCAKWRRSPQTGWHPFAPSLNYRLVLDFTDIASGEPLYRIDAVVAAKDAPPADVAKRLVDAALACAGCRDTIIVKR